MQRSRRNRIRLELFPVSICLLTLVSACQLFEYRLNTEKAQTTIKTIRAAEKRFIALNKGERYGELSELKSRGLIDPTLATGKQNGYYFEVIVEDRKFRALAVPIQYNRTGSWSFYVDESGVIKGTSLDRKANANDQPIRYQE